MGTKPKTQPLKTVEVWNRKIHYYLGLYLLFFVWLFAFSGLLLNNSGWRFFEFWEKRKESAEERAITRPAPGSDLAQANDLIRQLGVSGEVEWTASRGDNNRLNFRVTRPGYVIDINAVFQQKRPGSSASISTRGVSCARCTPSRARPCMTAATSGTGF